MRGRRSYCQGNSSACLEIKIAFDGYGEDGVDTNFESYVMYVNKNALNEGCSEFPEQELHGYQIVHRPDQETYIYFWHDKALDNIKLVNYEEKISESCLLIDDVAMILKPLYEKYKEGVRERFLLVEALLAFWLIFLGMTN